MLQKAPFKNILFSRSFVFGAICALASLLYCNSLWYDYIYLDDHLLIRDYYGFIKDISNIPEAFNRSVTGGYYDSYYRPLLTISFIIDAQFSGTDLFGYHVTNVLLHIISTYCVFVLLLRLGYATTLCFFFSLVFAVHPVFVQGVSWIPGRNDTLLAVFAVPSFIFLFDYYRKRQLLYLILHLMCFLLSLFTKETSVMIPLIVAIYSLIIAREKLFSRLNLFLYAGWLLTGSFWLLFRLDALTYSQNLNPVDISRIVMNNSPVLIQFAGKLLLPFNLSVYPIMRDTGFTFGIITCLLVLILIFFSKGKRTPYILFGLAWFVGFSVLAFIKTSDVLEPDFVEHRTYLPAVGFLIILLELDVIRKLPSRRGLFPVIAICIITLFSFLNYQHNKNYRNERAYWTNAIETSPTSSVAHRGMGCYFDRKNNYEKALEHYRISIQVNPRINMSHNNIAAIYIRQDKLAEAETELKKELSVDPLNSAAYFNMGIVYGLRNNLHEAGNYWFNAVMYDPNNEDASYNLGLYYLKHNSLDSAEKYFQRAVRLTNRFIKGIAYMADYHYKKKDKPKLSFYVDLLLERGERPDESYIEFLLKP